VGDHAGGDRRSLSEGARQVGGVRLLEGADLLLGEVHVERRICVGQVMRLGWSHDGSGDDRVLQHPGEPDPRHRDPPGLRYLPDRFDDGLVALNVEPPAHRVDVESVRVLAPRPREPSFGDRAVWDAAHPLVGEQAEQGSERTFPSSTIARTASRTATEDDP
jgi:hypothetical protein